MLGLLLLASMASGNDILTLETTLNTWVPITPTNLAAPSRILHSGVLVMDPHLSAEAMLIFGGYGAPIQDELVSPHVTHNAVSLVRRMYRKS